MIGARMIRNGGAPQAIKHWVFGLIHSVSRKTEQKPRTLRFRMGNRALLIDIRGRTAFGLIGAECIAYAVDPSHAMRHLIEAVRSANPEQPAIGARRFITDNLPQEPPIAETPRSA